MHKVIVVLILTIATVARGAEPSPYSVNLYGGILSSNDWDDLIASMTADYRDSHLAAATLARTIGRYKDLASFEVEGQVVKHFDLQDHWEFNALLAARWEAFWWDDHLDTSLAFGLGPSYATKEPEVEIDNDGGTSRLLTYWMLELSMALPQHKHTALILRLHHRSNAYGLVADRGGSNALVMGLKFRL